MLSLSRLFACSLLAVIVALPGGLHPRLASADDKKADDGFKPMFNGKNLDGWVRVNCHPDTFFVKGEEVITTGNPMGFLRTEKQYENFVLEMDWMHVNTKEVGNSGLFVWGDPLPATGTVYTRGIEVQVLVNLEYRDKKTNAITATSHGDLFSIWGAKCTPDRPHPLGWERCLPSEDRAKGGGEWNHYKVTANDGVIKLEVNGKEVSGISKCSPRKGYLALESEGAECHFKNMKIKELPSTNPKPEEIAKVSEGHMSLFNGLDLKGWEGKDKDAWKVKDGKIFATGKEILATEQKFEKYEIVFDWKIPAKFDAEIRAKVGVAGLHISPSASGGFGVGWTDGANAAGMSTDAKAIKPGTWNRMVVGYDGKTLTVTANGVLEFTKTFDKPLVSGPLAFTSAPGLEIMNVFVRELKEKK